MYAADFSGKPKGGYRISRKLICEIGGQSRLYGDDLTSLTRALLELGIVLVDTESFSVVMSVNAFVNYRRAGKGASRGE